MNEYKKVRLGDVCEFVRNGASIKQNPLCKNGIPITRIETISNDKFNFDRLGYADITDEKYSDYYLRDSDVLLSHINSAKYLGRSVMYKKVNDSPIIHGMNLLCLRFIQERYYPAFFVYYSQSNPAKAYIGNNTKLAVNQASITASAIKEMPIPLPPIETQKQIATILDKVQKIINNHKAMLEKYDILIKSRFVEMFGDPVTNPMGWEIKKLGDLIKVLGGYAFSSENFKERGIPVLRIGNINSGFFKQINMVYWDDDVKLERYAIYPNDLVMSLTGTVGKDDYGNVCILGNDYQKYYLNQRNAKLEIIKNLEKYYLTFLLKVPAIKKQLTGISRGVRQANIANKDIEKLQIPVPPLALQNQFATFVQQIDKSKANVQKSLEKTETLYKSLMQEYFG